MDLGKLGWCQQSESETLQRGRRLTGFRSRSHPAMSLISSWFSQVGRSVVILARVLAVLTPQFPGISTGWARFGSERDGKAEGTQRRMLELTACG